MHIVFYYLLHGASFGILFSSIMWEAYDDRKGDFDKGLDVVKRCLIVLVSALVSYVFREVANKHLWTNWHLFWLAYSKSVAMGVAIFFMFFDYVMNYVLGHKLMFRIDEDGWIQYTGKPVASNPNYNRFDNLNVWQRIGWEGRLIFKIVIFVGALVWFFM